MPFNTLALGTELVGAFIFIGVIMQYASKPSGPVAIGVALAAMVFFGGAISGGHYNPAVSLAMFLSDKIDLLTLIGYVVAQCIGGFGAHFLATTLGVS
jgi:aquaporin Z